MQPLPINVEVDIPNVEEILINASEASPTIVENSTVFDKRKKTYWNTLTNYWETKDTTAATTPGQIKNGNQNIMRIRSKSSVNLYEMEKENKIKNEDNPNGSQDISTLSDKLIESEKDLVLNDNNLRSDTKFTQKIGEFLDPSNYYSTFDRRPSNDIEVEDEKNKSLMRKRSTTDTTVIKNGITTSRKPIIGSKQTTESNSEIFPAKEIAKQLCIIDSGLFKKIQRSEFASLKWTGSEKLEKAPHIVEMTGAFNDISGWVANEILSAASSQKRLEKIVYYIHVAKNCVDFGNFNGMYTILGGLQCTPVFRLEKTWELLEKFYKKEKALMDKLNEISSHDRNSEMYRKKLTASKKPCIPYLGIFLADLTFLNEALKKEMNEARTQAVNDRKLVISNLLDEIEVYQQSCIFPFEFIPNIISTIVSRKFDQKLEKTLYELSYKVEEKGSKSKGESTPQSVSLKGGELGGNWLGSIFGFQYSSNKELLPLTPNTSKALPKLKGSSKSFVGNETEAESPTTNHPITDHSRKFRGVLKQLSSVRFLADGDEEQESYGHQRSKSSEPYIFKKQESESNTDRGGRIRSDPSIPDVSGINNDQNVNIEKKNSLLTSEEELLPDFSEEDASESGSEEGEDENIDAIVSKSIPNLNEEIFGMHGFLYVTFDKSTDEKKKWKKRWGRLEGHVLVLTKISRNRRFRPQNLKVNTSTSIQNLNEFNPKREKLKPLELKSKKEHMKISLFSSSVDLNEKKFSTSPTPTAAHSSQYLCTSPTSAKSTNFLNSIPLTNAKEATGSLDTNSKYEDGEEVEQHQQKGDRQQTFKKNWSENMRNKIISSFDSLKSPVASKEQHTLIPLNVEAVPVSTSTATPTTKYLLQVECKDEFIPASGYLMEENSNSTLAHTTDPPSLLTSLRQRISNLIEPTIEVASDEEDNSNYNFDEDECKIFKTSIIPCVMLLFGVLLIGLAAWPLLPHEETVSDLKLDQGERSLIEISPYWFKSVKLKMETKNSDLQDKPLLIYLMHQKPLVTKTTTIYRRICPILDRKNYYSVSHWELFSTSKMYLNWNIYDGSENEPFSEKPSFNIIVLQSQEAFNLWLNWGMAPEETIVYQQKNTTFGKSLEINFFQKDDYYLIYSLFNKDTKISNSEVQILIKGPTYSEIDPIPISKCVLANVKDECNFDLPEWAITTFVLLNSPSNLKGKNLKTLNDLETADDNILPLFGSQRKSLSDYRISISDGMGMDYSPAFKVSYTTVSRSSVFSTWWPLWFLVAIFALATGLFATLAILGCTCSLLSYLGSKICPSYFGDETDEELEPLLDYNGYGTLPADFEPLPLYIPSPIPTASTLQNDEIAESITLDVDPPDFVAYIKNNGCSTIPLNGGTEIDTCSLESEVAYPSSPPPQY
ncbi:RasGEF [Lobulomyces angularis]|nr:RasGEF [Lobulomyces angularis]